MPAEVTANARCESLNECSPTRVHRYYLELFIDTLQTVNGSIESASFICFLLQLLFQISNFVQEGVAFCSILQLKLILKRKGLAPAVPLKVAAYFEIRHQVAHIHIVDLLIMDGFL